ncbi:MAG: histidine kinase [Clostridia bacterium]|nr:histidine kinase [Clostridia bacterium]
MKGAFLERILPWLKATSIRKLLWAAHLTILLILLIPAMVSMWVMSDYARQYHRVIDQVSRVSDLKPLVTETIPDEVFSIVAGRESFRSSTVFESIAYVNASLEELSASQPTQSSKELAVARGTMNTLTDYVRRMEALERENAPVAASEGLLEEVRGVAALVGDILVDYNNQEISVASSTSLRLQQTVNTLVLAESLVLAAAVGFSLLAQRALTRAVQNPLANLEAFAGDIARGNLMARVPDTTTEELVKLTGSLNIMAGKLQNLIEENRLEQENLKKSELRTLQAQIAPHFLYNTLDAIVCLAEAKRSDEVIQITKALSDFFRISLSQGRDWIPLSEEVKHLHGYLTIQRIRYRDILDYEIDIPETLRNYEVLKLLIQPLVENAIYHGIKSRRGAGKVTIRIREQGEALVFTVSDNGVGIPPERLQEIQASLRGELRLAQGDAGYGLSNVNMRIMLYYNQEQGIRIETGGSGTRVSFTVPIRRTSNV